MDIYYSNNWLYFYEFVVAVDCHSVQLALVPVEIWFATFVFHIKKGDDIAYEDFDRDRDQSLDDVIVVSLSINLQVFNYPGQFPSLVCGQFAFRQTITLKQVAFPQNLSYEQVVFPLKQIDFLKIYLTSKLRFLYHS